MKNKIKEVQNYFSDKLARGLYKVEEISEHTIKVIVDKEYHFALWVANGESAFSIWNIQTNFIHVNFTDKQKVSGYKHAFKHRQGWEDTELRDKELKQLETLQTKYAKLLNLSA
jgi:hypothetical protein